MQARRGVARFPLFTGDELDEALALHLRRIMAQRKGEARARALDPAAGIELPQPVGLVLLELAKQQGDDFVLFRRAGLGDASG